MPANLTTIDGEVQFAYARQYGDPWHKLGTPVEHLMTIDEALELVNANDTVEPGTLYMRNEDSGKLEEVPERIGLRSDIYGPISTSGPNYEIMQRREIVELAYEIIGLSNEGIGTGPAALDTVGNIGPRAEKFFAYLRTPDLVIDEGGVGDVIKGGLLVATSFDSSLKNTIGKTATRAVCENTVQVGIQGMIDGIQIRHTVNAEQRIRQAARALEYAGMAEIKQKEEIESWLKLDGAGALNMILDNLWPIDSDLDLPHVTHQRRLNQRDSVRYFYSGEGNSCVDAVGPNAWAAYNALTEYLDHHRPVRDRKNEGGDDNVKRAESAVLPGEVYKTKVRASGLITAMKG